MNSACLTEQSCTWLADRLDSIISWAQHPFVNSVFTSFALLEAIYKESAHSQSMLEHNPGNEIGLAQLRLHKVAALSTTVKLS